jgi:hypothetical protein
MLFQLTHPQLLNVQPIPKTTMPDVMLCCACCLLCPAAYLMQYVPQLGLAVMKQIGPKRAKAISSGQSGYNLSAMLNTGSTSSGQQ